MFQGTFYSIWVKCEELFCKTNNNSYDGVYLSQLSNFVEHINNNCNHNVNQYYNFKKCIRKWCDNISWNITEY